MRGSGQGDGIETRHARRVVIAMAVAVALAGAACAGDGYEYVSNSGDGLYFRVPDEWTVQEPPDGPELPLPAGQEDAGEGWARIVAPVGFDSSALEVLDQVDAPIGIAQVEDLNVIRRDQMSLERLRALSLDIVYEELESQTAQAASETGESIPPELSFEPPDPFEVEELSAAEENPPLSLAVLDYEEITTDDGVHGSRIRFNLRRGNQDPQTIEHIALLDRDRTRLYRLYVSCTAECFAEWEDEISDIFESWTVEES